MKKLLLIFLVLVFLISGCMGQGDKSQANNGIIIKDFSFDYSPIYSGEQIGLTLEVQNVGEERGILKKVTIYGVDVKEGSSSELTWGLPKPGETFKMDTSHTDFPKDPLFPPDPTTGFEGDTWYYSWLPQAPTQTRTSTDYTFDVRVEYGYSTIYTGTVRIIDNDYLRTLTEDERNKLIEQGGVVESSVSGGPLSVSGASGRHFIVRSSNSEERGIKFKVENVGSGFAYDTDLSDTTKLHQIRVANVMPSEFIRCDKTTLKLSRGKTGMLSCNITVPGLSSEWTNKLDKKFSIILAYEYYVDGKTSITVNPTYEETTGYAETTSTTTTPITTDCTDAGGACSTVGVCRSLCTAEGLSWDCTSGYTECGSRCCCFCS